MSAPLRTTHAPSGPSGRLSATLPRADHRDAYARAAQVAAAVLASLLVAVALAESDQGIVLAGAIAGVGLLALGFIRPAAFLMVFLLLRPLMDQISNINLGVPGANVAGAVSLMLIVMAVSLVLVRRRLVFTPTMAGYLGVVLVTCAASLVAVSDFGATVGATPISEAIRVGCGLALLLLAANCLRTPDRVRTLLIVAGLSGLVPAIWAITELPTALAGDAASGTRASGPFVGPNPLAQYLAVTILILMALPREWISSQARWLALAPQLVAIVPTFSRVGWVSLLVGIFLLKWRDHKRVLLATIVVVGAVVMLVPPVHERAFPTQETQSLSSPATYESYSWRTQNWVTLLERWQQSPFIGYGTSTTVFVNPRRPFLKRLAPDAGFAAHNLVVRVLVEGGLALLAVYLLFAAALTVTLRRLVRDRWQLRPLARLVAILWSMFLLVGLTTDDPFDNTAELFVLLTLTGALEGAYRFTKASRAGAAARQAEPSLFLPARPRTS